MPFSTIVWNINRNSDNMLPVELASNNTESEAFPLIKYSFAQIEQRL